MREVHIDTVIAKVRDMVIEANYHLRADTITAFEQALQTEESPIGREVLSQLLQNARVAAEGEFPFCQDTGYAVLFVEIGQEVHIAGGGLTEALDEGVRRGYAEGYLRKSLVKNPLQRVNTGDNTPAMIYYDLVPGAGFKLGLLIKGAGCDNMSALTMLTPAQGEAAMLDFVVETIEKAGPNASPPVTIGVGIGGTFERAALLAKKALLWPLNQPNPDPKLAGLEAELLRRINALGIGPAGYGGTTTALGVHIEAYATHIASFPVAVNIDCHSHRGIEAEL
jgi:fumarate hydratase subunit alpha